MPLLHWYCYSFLEQIFNYFTDFATDFGNDNIMSKAHPITKLNTSALENALTVLKTFCYQINLHQVTMTAIMAMPSSVTAYTVNPWNNTQASRPKKDERNFPQMAHLVPLPTPLSCPNNIMDVSTTLQHLI
jgi:hypothetical protein